MMTTELDKRKADMRTLAKTRRKVLAHTHPDAAVAVLAHLLDYLATAPKSLAGYWPIGSELDPRPVMERVREMGAEIALPAVIAEAKPLVFRGYRKGDALITEAFATRAPAMDAPQIIPDVVLVPMLAFDERGYRLGYGGGFYDRSMAQLQQQSPNSRFIGLAYAGQKVDETPTGAYDLPLKVIVTEQGVLQP